MFFNRVCKVVKGIVGQISNSKVGSRSMRKRKKGMGKEDKELSVIKVDSSNF